MASAGVSEKYPMGKSEAGLMFVVSVLKQVALQLAKIITADVTQESMIVQNANGYKL